MDLSSKNMDIFLMKSAKEVDQGKLHIKPNNCVSEGLPNIQEFLLPKQPVFESHSKGSKETQDKAQIVPKDFNKFLTTLPSCSSEEMIDDFAIKFATTYYTTKAKEKLIKTLCDMERLSLDIIPFYARLVATMNPIAPEIALILISFLKKKLNYYVTKKENDDLLGKLKILNFSIELIKFGLFFNGNALDNFKSLITTKNKKWAQIYSNDTSRLMRLATLIFLRYTTGVESCLLKHKSENFTFECISKLIYKDSLTSGKELRTMETIRLLNWEDPKIADHVIKCMSNAWKVKFEDIEKFAFLTWAFANDFGDIAVKIVDAVLEEIRVDTDSNSSNYKRRISMIKYLGELHNLGLLNSDPVFNTLYFLIMSGFDLNFHLLSPSDPPRSTTRIKLACMLIKTCGEFFTSLDRKKLARFFTYFQHYYWMKKSLPIWGENTFTFPKDTQYMFEHCREKYCPKVPLCSSYDEAAEALDDLKKKILPETDVQNNPDCALYFPGFNMHKIRYVGDDCDDGDESSDENGEMYDDELFLGVEEAGDEEEL